MVPSSNSSTASGVPSSGPNALPSTSKRSADAVKIVCEAPAGTARADPRPTNRKTRMERRRPSSPRRVSKPRTAAPASAREFAVCAGATVSVLRPHGADAHGRVLLGHLLVRAGEERFWHLRALPAGALGQVAVAASTQSATAVAQ